MSEENLETWMIDEGELENGLSFTLRFREDLPDESLMKKLGTLVVVSWEFDSADGTGMPAEKDVDQMEDFEDLIDEAIVEKGTARLMTVFTGEGVREWQYYTDDVEFFMQKFNEALADGPALPLDIEAFEDENWNAYKDYTGFGLQE